MAARPLIAREPFLYDPCFFKRRIDTISINGLNRARREFEPDGPAELRHKESFFLQVRLPTAYARRVELRRTRAV